MEDMLSPPGQRRALTIVSNAELNQQSQLGSTGTGKDKPLSEGGTPHSSTTSVDTENLIFYSPFSVTPKSGRSGRTSAASSVSAGPSSRPSTKDTVFSRPATPMPSSQARASAHQNNLENVCCNLFGEDSGTPEAGGHVRTPIKMSTPTLRTSEARLWHFEKAAKGAG